MGVTPFKYQTMLKVSGTCHLLDDDDYMDYSITFYLDASMIPADQIDISGNVSGVSLKFLSSYYITDLDFNTIMYLTNVSDDSTMIVSDDSTMIVSDDSTMIVSDDSTMIVSDDQDDGSFADILNSIRQMKATDWSDDVKLVIDNHWNCYCKYRKVCGCGCDPKHDGWA